MANRAPSPSSSSSAGELPNINSLNKSSPHPEEWTLPQEWNIEKREMFANWKMDVQNQISNIAGQLSSSLQKHPRNDIPTDIDYSDAIEDNELRKSLVQQEKEAGHALHLGLARVPVNERLA